MIFLIFPNQLFEFSVFENVATKTTSYFLVEDPAFLGDRKPVKLRLNKQRLAYQRYLCLKFVATNPQVTFVPVNAVSQFLKTHAHEPKMFFDPMDHIVSKRYGTTATILDTPAFILTNKDVQDWYQSKKGRRLRHAPFYKYMKHKLGLLEDVASQDAQNRAAYPRTAPPPPSVYPKYTARDRDIMDDAAAWVRARFPRNPGDIDTTYLLNLPSSHKEALLWLDKFLKERFAKFGQYQDAIVEGQPWMFHSGLSIPLNYGLITPHDILKNVATFLKSHNIPLQSHEGFVRQIIGWREYCRLYYVCVPARIYRKNHLKMKRTPLTTEWYKGTTNIPIVDDAIKDAWKYGYLHHIRRLMVMSNYMTLRGIHPDNIYKWMYEFSLDSNDVFMVFNCYSMGSYSDGGYATHKPYVSGPGYIKKQSHAQNGDWADKWLQLYHRFQYANP